MDQQFKNGHSNLQWIHTTGEEGVTATLVGVWYLKEKKEEELKQATPTHSLTLVHN